MMIVHQKMSLSTFTLKNYFVLIFFNRTAGFHALPAKFHRLDFHGYFSRSTKCQKARIQSYLTLLIRGIDILRTSPGTGPKTTVFTFHRGVSFSALAMPSSPWEILGELAIAAPAQCAQLTSRPWNSCYAAAMCMVCGAQG